MFTMTLLDNSRRQCKAALLVTVFLLRVSTWTGAFSSSARTLRPLFSVKETTSRRKQKNNDIVTLFALKKEEGDEFLEEDGTKKIMSELASRHEELRISKERSRLEDANIQSFIKRKPLKLPYEDARKWVQANLGVDTKEEFYDFVANGNLRTPYIPKRPEEYYRGTREWISWDHFLTGVFDNENPSAIRPATGIFD